MTDHDPVRVLFLAASPRETPQLELDRELREIHERIRLAGADDALDVRSGWAVRARDLLQYLNQHRPHVVHFSGHGSETGAIALEDDQRQVAPVSPRALQHAIRSAGENVRLVVLNACFSLDQANAMADVAGCAIGSTRAISDADAITFAGGFYSGIGFGHAVQRAFDQGVARLLLEQPQISDDQLPRIVARLGVDAAALHLGGHAADTTGGPPRTSPRTSFLYYASLNAVRQLARPPGEDEHTIAARLLEEAVDGGRSLSDTVRQGSVQPGKPYWLEGLFALTPKVGEHGRGTVVEVAHESAGLRVRGVTSPDGWQGASLLSNLFFAATRARGGLELLTLVVPLYATASPGDVEVAVQYVAIFAPLAVR